ncbi:acyltransferase [Hymenobacter lutimineralis]|uniref:Acyltransferase n=1 Tax=Hymenobacter lutimineralis TaxID=2606448 RepID=A0A5D6V987_9BACT|nr:acyltransferase [Hymenobacter lutimineralis]TYZ11910.1 acyltransferase [Hymenobacter lutimineralis]
MTAPATTASRRSLSYQELDILHALRGFCAFYVVIFHAKFILWSGGQQYLQAFPRSGWGIKDYAAFAVDMLSSAGYEMVIFFFVLSGFFIHYAQQRKYRGPKDFYLNRVVRIYPPFLVSLVLAALALTVLATQVPQVLQPEAGRELNQTLTTAWQELRQFNLVGALRSLAFLKLGEQYLGHNTVYWSLLPEALFYLLVPFVLRTPRIYYVLSVISYGVGVLLERFGYGGLSTSMLQYNLFFAMGVALYDVVVQTAVVEQVRRLPRWLVWLGLAGMLLVLIGLALVKFKIAAALVSAVLAVVAVLALLAGHVSAKNLLVRVLHRLGVYSFSLYLYHFPLLLLCYGMLVSATGQLFWYQRYYLLIVPVVALVCYALYWLTERVSVNYFRKV